jgi:hypothetical protein
MGRKLVKPPPRPIRMTDRYPNARSIGSRKAGTPRTFTRSLIDELVEYLVRYRFHGEAFENYIAAVHNATSKRLFVVVVQNAEELALWGPVVRGVTLDALGFKDAIYRATRYWMMPPQTPEGPFNMGTLTESGYKVDDDLISRHQSIDCAVAEKGPDWIWGALNATSRLHPAVAEDRDWLAENYPDTTWDRGIRERLTSRLREDCASVIANSQAINGILGSAENVNRFYLVHS